MKEIIINGKRYPLWEQFVHQKEKWIGGTLTDRGDSMDRAIFGVDSMTTTITDIKLEPNGKESAIFSVCGEDFTCGFDVQHGGAIPSNDDGLVFSGYGGHIKINLPKKSES